VEDPRGIRVRVIPGRWARSLPRIPRTLEPFSGQ
jgi:hypothetical protein